MLFQTLTFSVIILFIVQGKELDSGPQVFTSLKNSSQIQSPKPHKRFVTKDVIVYLTPSQIKDLESGNAELRSTSPDDITINPVKHHKSASTPQDSYHRHLENLNILKAPLIPDPRLQAHDTETIENLLLKQRLISPKVNFQNHLIGENKNQVSTEEWRPFIPVIEKKPETQTEEQINEFWQQFITKNGNRPPVLSHFDARNHELINYLREANEKHKAIADAADFANISPVVISKHEPVAIPFNVIPPIHDVYAVKVPRLHPVPADTLKNILLSALLEQTKGYTPSPGGNVHTEAFNPNLYARRN
ncbi:unnamed protein product [Leptosia nina]|uniref:Uncharacterized protein n=1 Tax=Leptosia nina TaxID=320188 RepID=A0AAV1J3L5_9NEOP